MRTRPAGSIAIAALLLSGGRLLAQAPTDSWQSGRVISAVVSGHGPAEPQQRKKLLDTTDIWWTYCISAGAYFYSVLSRESPAKTGLTNNRRIRFSEKKGEIDVVGPRGKNIALRILRKDKSRKCP